MQTTTQLETTPLGSTGLEITLATDIEGSER
jgi:hypothetical protein